MIVTDDGVLRSSAGLVTRLLERIDLWLERAKPRPESLGGVGFSGPSGDRLREAYTRDRAHVTMARNEVIAKGVLKTCVQHDRIMVQTLFGESQDS